MEKRVYELKIDPELRDLFPPLTEEEQRMLEDSIVRSGCDTPLTVWNDFIVDGHNRYEICRRHQIPFAYEERHFIDKEAAMFWMLEHQLARRNLNSYQRSELALKFEPLIRKIAALHQITSTGGASPRPRQNTGITPMKTMEELGKMAGVSHDTINKVRRINERASEETKKKLRAGEVSIHKAYTDLMNGEHPTEKADMTIKRSRLGMPVIYVCSPYRGDTETNVKNAQRYCRLVIQQGGIPFAPHLLFTQILDDDLEGERRLGMYMGTEMLKLCDELWVFGSPSSGMLNEMTVAETLGIPIKRFDLKEGVVCE